MSEPTLETFVITTANGRREWQAEDADHAAEQHEDAFADEPGEQIIAISRTVKLND